MKKLHLLFIGVLSMSTIYAQELSDALRYSQDNIQGTARFRALSGAFGALGGDMSAVSINPASSAVFSQSHASFSLGNTEFDNDTNYFGTMGTTNDSHFDILQGGASFVFRNTSNSPWKKFSIGVAYDRTNSFDDSWVAAGTNTNSADFNNSIASYFFDYAVGKPFGEIRSFDDETLDEAYFDIGNSFGFAHQQAFLGYESFILEPAVNDDSNTAYLINMTEGNFSHNYSYISQGYTGKIAVNLAAQYGDNLYLGANFNSHFIDFERSTLLFENNSNNPNPAPSDINVGFVEFENNLATTGTGFSFQIGGILKLTDEFRVGLTYDSPIWYRIEEETTQFLGTAGVDSGQDFTQSINPQVVNIYPAYRLQTPAKITASGAYVFGNIGLVSFDYSRKNYGSAKLRPDADFPDLNADIDNILTNASTYRLGGEFKHKQFSFRGGYRFEESPYENGTTIGDLTGFSLGLGYNFGNTRLDLTYDRWEREDEMPLYSVGLIDTTTIDRQNSNITLTLGFNI
ncbi:outer membrane protein transport protein [Hyunsoonleella sp. SJ7]|uniref:Outer membrane protein transport protein n=1 Tax=Hyunsoonleella aquatilis TaxID=2762758 RepID=A0A923KLZ0_9FLAO|nr:outer membrane protein transport protein [Hyunsoonleella aquatilis]MBC3759278.1 outer membrane protein transport protein [Hyunsoonleella aquatilis]